MNTPEKPKRPCWTNKKRCWAAVVALLIVAYPASLGPVEYAAVRGWISNSVESWYFTPYAAAVWTVEDYVRWWAELGKRHREPN